MKPRALHLFLSALFAVLHFSPNAHSQLLNVPGVYGTGVASPGILITEGSVDPHYTIVSGPATGASYVVNSALMASTWIPNGPTSSWVSFSPSSDSTSTGTYVYRTTFDLTGYSSSTAVLSGFWNTDNNGVGISLNGASFPFTTPFESFFQSPSPFTISSGFVSGLNTLDFTLFDGGGKTGLRVDGLQVKAAISGLTILYVGSNTPSNTLDLSSGAHAYLKTYVGFTEDSTNNTLSVRNAGTLLSNDDSLTVGEGGSGNRMVVSNGATVLSAAGYIGAAATASNNAVLVTGAGSVWQNTGLLHVGYLGSNNSLTIADGGTVAASGIVLGLTNGASGVLNIGRLGEHDAGGTLNTPSINMGSVDSLINFNQTNTITLASSIGGLGSLHQNGTGTTILTGLNTYSGVSVINAGTLQIGDGGTSGTIGSGDITNNSRLVINRSDTYIITNNIFGTGELIQMGGSTIVIDGGGGGGGSSGGGSSGGGSGSTTIGNVIGGSTGLTKVGEGTLILTADNTYTGTTTIGGGTLQLGDETPAGSTGPGAIVNNATLAIKRNNTFVLGNFITGSGQVRQTGTGTTVMTGANSYTGPTTVTNGSLLVNGSATSSTFTARDNGVLGGSGIIGAANIIKGGTLAPGSSIGSLHTGALSFSDGSALAIELDSADASADLVVVSGGLSLDGLVSLTLNDIAASPAPFALDTTLSLLNYSGSWNGGLFTYGSTQLANGATFSAGLNQWRIVYNALSGGQNLVSDHQPGGAFVNIKSVPEPSTYALLLMTGAGALWWARRRR